MNSSQRRHDSCGWSRYYPRDRVPVLVRVNVRDYLDNTMTLYRRTLSDEVTLQGVGIHSGNIEGAVVRPAGFGEGLRVVDHHGHAFPVHVDFAATRPGASVLQRGDFSVWTPEHLLAALVGCGITDADILVEGDEVPILDGSAAPWVEQFEAAGVVCGPEVVPHVIQRERLIDFTDARAHIWPGDQLTLSVSIDFVDGPVGTREVDIPQDFAKIADARTFVMAKDLETFRAQERGRGITSENTVVFQDSAPINHTRYPDEAVRHKLLDLLGDLAFVGRPLLGRIHVERGTHAVHQDLMRDILANG